MASALNALPTITATALGASLGTGVAAGQYKAPTAIVGYTVPMDSLNFYVGALDAGLISTNSTATSTQNSANQTNTVHRGATFYYSFTSIGATCTAGINFLAVDTQQTGNSYVMYRASIDGMTSTAQGLIQIYPGGPTSGGGSGFTPASGTASGVQQNGILTGTYAVQVSITATASAGGANATIRIGQSKSL